FRPLPSRERGEQSPRPSTRQEELRRNGRGGSAAKRGPPRPDIFQAFGLRARGREPSDALAGRRSAGAPGGTPAGRPWPGEGRRNPDRSREAARCGMPEGNPLGEDWAMAQPLLSDALWRRLEPLLPPPRPRRGRFPGRKPLDARKALTGILLVLLTGIPWKAFPKQLGCGCGLTCANYLKAWRRAGAWPRVYQGLLADLGAGGEIDCPRAEVALGALASALLRTRSLEPPRSFRRPPLNANAAGEVTPPSRILTGPAPPRRLVCAPGPPSPMHRRPPSTKESVMWTQFWQRLCGGTQRPTAAPGRG